MTASNCTSHFLPQSTLLLYNCFPGTELRCRQKNTQIPIVILPHKSPKFRLKYQIGLAFLLIGAYTFKRKFQWNIFTNKNPYNFSHPEVETPQGYSSSKNTQSVWKVDEPQINVQDQLKKNAGSSPLVNPWSLSAVEEVRTRKVLEARGIYPL